MEKTTSFKSEELFNLNAYNELLKLASDAANNGDEDAIEDVATIKKATDSFHGYVNTVDMTETRIKIARFRYESEEYREIVQEADRARRIAHEAAIANASMLNRIAKFYGIKDPIFLGDTTDRYQVADFCLCVTVALFREANGGVNDR